MSCGAVGAVGGCGTCGGAGGIQNIANNAMGALGGAADGPQDLMSRVQEILRKLGLDGQNAGQTGAMSKDDFRRLFEALQQLGPQKIKEVLNQNPGLTNAMTQAV